jgi:hypothetical protein
LELFLGSGAQRLAIYSTGRAMTTNLQGSGRGE